MGNLIYGVLVLLVTSVIGGGSYALCRKIEKAWHHFPTFVVALLFVFITISILVSWSFFPGLMLLPWLLIIILPSVVGATFHLRSGGSSFDGLAALVTMATSITLSFFCGGFLDLVFRPISLGGVEDYLVPLYYLCLWAYPALAPLALWIWQNLRIRPGVDEPLKSESAPADST